MATSMEKTQLNGDTEADFTFNWKRIKAITQLLQKQNLYLGFFQERDAAKPKRTGNT